MALKTKLARALLSAANTIDPAMLPRAIEPLLGAAMLETEQALAAGRPNDSAYWCDEGDPLARVHGKEKCAALERRLLAMTVVAWMTNSKPEAQAAAADLLRRHHPELGDTVPAALKDAIGLTSMMQALIALDMAEAAREAAPAPQAGAAC
jgi:hypothetical protein